MAMSRMCLLTACVLCAAGSAFGLTPDELTQKTGVAGGLCAFPRLVPGDSGLAIELAKRPAFVVHAASTDEKVLAVLRGQAEAAGLLGRSLYVEKGAAGSLPFADRLVDLLVASDVREAALLPERRTEWLRVLAPGRGVAWLAEGRTLKAPLPPGSDAWSHRCHGADNAQVSDDRTFKPPFLTQWWALPRQEGFWGTTVVSGNGRLFALRASRATGNDVFLTARSLTSGLVLWQQTLRQDAGGKRLPHGGYLPGRSCAAVAGDTLCLADRDGVVRLDGETGATRDRVAGPRPGGQVKWLACV